MYCLCAIANFHVRIQTHRKKKWKDMLSSIYLSFQPTF